MAKIDVLESRVNNHDRAIEHIDKTVSQDYATNEKVLAVDRRLSMIEKVVYGMILLIVIPVVTGLVYLVVQQP